MKRTNLKNPALLTIFFAGLLMMGAFQNCSNQMAFEAPANDQKVSPMDDTLPDDGTDVGTTDPGTTPGTTPPLPGDTDDDTDIDYDHDGRRIVSSCTTGANSKFNEAELLAAQDLSLVRQRGLIFRYKNPLRYVDVRDVKGAALSIENAHTVTRYEDVNSALSVVRAITINSVSDVQGAISTSAAVRLDLVEKVRAAYVCASGREIGKLHDIEGGFIKVRGRNPASGSTSTANSTAKEISKIRSGHTSIYKVDVTNISDIQGEVIIRNSTIETIEGLRGGLTLINSTVRNLKDARGSLRLLNSKVDNRSDVQMNEITLRPK